MARLPRLFAPDTPAHITVRANDGRDFFRCDGDRFLFRDSLKDACDQHGVTLHAYVFMTNHVHLLGTGAARESIPRVIQSVGRRYVWHFNFRHSRKGGLWEGRYRSTLVDTDGYLLVCHRYIDVNPVRAGIVARPADYRWSSYRHYAYDIKDELVTPHPTVLALGQTPERRMSAYRGMFATALDDEVLRRIRYCSRGGWALGGEDFYRRLELAGARRPRASGAGYPRGRPRRKRS